MALETGNYINDLVITNPTSTDPKSQGDDQIRLLKTVLKETINGFTGAAFVVSADTGTATGHVLTPPTALVSYTPGLCLLYKAGVTNTGAITVNVSGLGVKSIKTMAGADPTAGDIVAGYQMIVSYDGTNFVMIAGSEFLSKTGTQKLTGNFTVDGNTIVTGTLGVAGNTAVIGTLQITGQTTLAGATGVTVTTGDNTTNLATTAFVTTAASYLAPLAGAVFTGAITVLAPTAAFNPATKAYVDATATVGGMVPIWVSGNTYSAGNMVYSPLNFQTYRHSTSTSSLTTDPSLDTTNWVSLGSSVSAGSALYLSTNYGAM